MIGRAIIPVYMQDPNNPLQKQLEISKFLSAARYVEHNASGIKKLSTNELSYLNQLSGGEQDEPWRFEPVEIQLPNGKRHHFNVISNPISRARDLIGESYLFASNGDVVSAAIHIYTQLVLEHLFREANRRTAVLASYWYLCAYGLRSDPELLLGRPIGDLRDPKDLQTLRESLQTMLTKS